MDERSSSASPGAALPDNVNEEIHRLREALRASQQKAERLQQRVNLYSNAQLLVSMGSWEINPETETISLSPELRKLFNIDPDYTPTIDAILERVAPEHKSAAHDLLAGPLSEGETRTARIRIDPHQGGSLYLRISAHIGIMANGQARRFGIAQDIAELAEAERVIKEKEERWQLALEGSQDGVWDWDLTTNNVHYSDRWKNMLGYETDDLPDGYDTWAQLIHPQDLDPATTAISDYLEGRTKHYSTEFRMRTKDGDWRWVLSRGMAIFNQDGAPTRMLGTHTDITERKKQEEAFKRLSLIASKTTTGVVMTDAKGLLTWVNKAFERMTGYYMEEVLGKSPGSILQGSASDKNIAKQMRDCVRSGQGFHVEILNYRKSGVPFWVEVEATPIHDVNGKLVNFIAISNDITTRRLDRERIEESERRFRDISNAAGEFIWEHDVNGYFTYASDRVKDVLGYSPGEFIGRHPSEICVPSFKDQLSTRMLGHFRREETFTGFEVPNICKDGSTVWLSISGVPMHDRNGQMVGFRGAAMDITQRKQAEDELSKLYQRFQLATNSARIGIWEFDFATNTLEWDSIMFEIYRLPYDRFTGKMDAWSRVMLPEDNPNFQATLETAIERGGNYRLNFRIRWPEGDIRHITGNALVMLNEDNQPARIIGSSWDITEQKRAEEDAIAARDTAEEANRAKSAFLAMMSHEIRTPMNGVIGMLQALRESNLDDNQKDYVDIIESSSGSLMTIIDDILDYSKVEAGRLVLDLRPINIATVVTSALSLYTTHAAEKKLELVHRIDNRVPPAVLGDEMRIRQVIVNLISNAIKFTDRGRVTIKVSANEIGDGTVQLHFSVADTGIGFSKEQAESLFEPFVQADTSITRRHGGTGLGLAISRRLVELMGGQIWCESSRLLGTIFHFTVNAEVTDASKLTSKQNPELGRVNYEGRILLAEDNPINRKVVQFVLNRLGCVVDHAENGQEAIDMFARDTYDLVLMDVQMPELDGLAATRGIRQMSGDTETPWIIGLSAAAMKEDREAAYNAGMNDFLNKPLKPQELEAALRRAPQITESAG
ncbi:PAS domain S-box protein [Cerasicoccus fimbriatus]|uniref:PAS domain S-box protein n=1 Tax=Cerasicoccus fimbriatus TaxID=3014554 RepID=UPI0022B5032F|nr:PAS domain S-box protein [Cerasicoccus sp. TK19100]